MLVLTRKPSQRILIGPDIKVTVVRIDGNTVRLGIEAPQGIEILREEITWKDDKGQGNRKDGNR